MNTPLSQDTNFTFSQYSLQHILNTAWMQGTALMLLCACILFINIDGWDLWLPDQPRYAQVAREMLKTGDYLVPHLGAKVYPNKPPLFFWLIAICSMPYGDVTPASARLPSAFATLGVVLSTYFLGRKLYNSLTGFVAGLILFTGIEFFWLATRAQIDMTLTLWTTLALLLFYCGYTGKKFNSAYYLLSYLFMGLAVLTKGPVGFLIPLIAIFLFFTAKREFRKFKEINLFKGLLIVLGTVSLWLVPACIMAGADYTQNILLIQNLGRVKNSFSHRAPFYYYLIHFPRDFLPWSLFIPSAVVYFWRERHRGTLSNLLFPGAWFIGGFIFFSFISSKRDLYLLPLYPAAALLMARFWYENAICGKTEPQKSYPPLLRGTLHLFFGVLMVCSIGIPVGYLLKLHFVDDLGLPGDILYCMSVFTFCAGAVGNIFTFNKKNVILPLSVIMVTIALLFLCIVLMVFPSKNAGNSPRPFFERVEKTVSPEDTLVYYSIDHSLFYFLKRSPVPDMQTYSEIKQTLSTPRKVYCLLEEKDYKNAPEEIKLQTKICDEGMFGHQKYYLVLKRPAK